MFCRGSTNTFRVTSCTLISPNHHPPTIMSTESEMALSCMFTPAYAGLAPDAWDHLDVHFPIAPMRPPPPGWIEEYVERLFHPPQAAPNSGPTVYNPRAPTPCDPPKPILVPMLPSDFRVAASPHFRPRPFPPFHEQCSPPLYSAPGPPPWVRQSGVRLTR